MVPDDGQFCIIKESKELVRFIGNLNGDYHCELGVIEDCFGYIKIVRLTDVEMISPEEAEDFDRLAYRMLKEYDGVVDDET